MWLWLKTHQNILEHAALASIIMFFVVLIVVPFILIRLPEYYLVDEDSRTPARLSPARWPYLILKNMMGIILAAAGLAMLVLPGQGLLTLAIALSFIDIPGKRRLVRAIICRPRILKTINWLRSKANKPALKPPCMQG